MTGRVLLYEDTVESLSIDIKTSADPTGTLPQFALSTDATQPGTFQIGAWSGSYNSSTQLTTALTPTLGATGATLTIATGTSYTLWAKVTVGSEIAVWSVGTIAVA